MKSGSLMISLNYGVKNFNSENYIANSQICFLSSTRMIKCIDRIMAYCNSYCFGLWKVWLKIQSTALHSRSLYCRNCVFKKKMSWDFYFRFLLILIGFINIIKHFQLLPTCIYSFMKLFPKFKKSFMCVKVLSIMFC